MHMEPNAHTCAWRDPEFIAAVKGRVSTSQFDRFKRMFHQPFYVLSGTADDAEMRFAVSGSERDEYSLRAVRSTGRISCSCRDACVNCPRFGVICKHLCFLLYRVLRHDDVSAMLTRGLDAAAFDALLPRARQVADQTRRSPSSDTNASSALSLEDGVTAPASAVLSEWEIDQMCEAMQRMNSGRVPARLTPKRAFTAVGRPPDADSECPVCYDALLPQPESLRGCPSCGQAVHVHCARRWMASAPRASCVYCRSPEWAHWDGK